MIIFHEGLPRSGKSYAALVDHIIKALKKGRKVFAYIEGLDFQRISEASEIPLETVQELLTQITREQVPDIYKFVQNDSLIVIDELQNFWPTGRGKLSPEITQFVTEHGHRGLDILCMGQVLGDCHSIWRGRVDTKIIFRKRDSIGKENEYRWTVCRALGAGKFKETTSGVAKYDPKYFGCYASHTDGTGNTDNYADDRANIKNSKAFKFVKGFGIVWIIAIGVAIWFFASGGGAKKTEPAKVDVDPNKVAAQVNAGAQEKTPGVPGASKPEQKPPSEKPGQGGFASVDDYIDGLMTNGNRIRLGGSLRTSKRWAGYIEWRDGSSRIVERLTFAELQGLGWWVMVSADGGLATLSRPGRVYVATQWPTADDRAAAPERVPDATAQSLKTGVDAPHASVPERRVM